MLTGPVHVEGARPGDMLEVRILDVEIRVPYGVNATGPGRGAATDLLQEAADKIIQLDLQRNVALFSPGVEVPLAPFMGIVAVAPPPELKRVSTKPPGAFGGNLDFKHLVAGSTLYLPVFNDGALFYTGDGHACQGDGEVDGTAIEISLTPTVQLIVHKGAGGSMKWPRAEDAANYYSMGMADDPRRGAQGGDPGSGGIPGGRRTLGRGGLCALQPRGRFPHRRGGEQRADGLRRHSQALVQEVTRDT